MQNYKFHNLRPLLFRVWESLWKAFFVCKNETKALENRVCSPLNRRPIFFFFFSSLGVFRPTKSCRSAVKCNWLCNNRGRCREKENYPWKATMRVWRDQVWKKFFKCKRQIMKKKKCGLIWLKMEQKVISLIGGHKSWFI